MKLVYESRACAVLFNVLCSQNSKRPFLLPSNVCPIVPITLLKAGCNFSLVDISAEDFFIDRNECLRMVSKAQERYGGIIFVRTYGAEIDPGEFFAELKRLQPSLFIIDDKCLCSPDYDGLGLNPLADVTLFSSGYSKYVDLGFGGFAFLKDFVPHQRHARKFTESALIDMTKRCNGAVAKRSLFEAAEGEWLDLAEPCFSWQSYRRRLMDATSRTAQHK